ncbi:MAG: hypothetical protein CMC82_00260 [Flavobacteriaceae bacterium]|nr:hypothetical protein [Flavobacteriaceae bacterium]
MIEKSKLLLILFLPIVLSCTTINLQTKVNPPVKSYVKIYHKVSITKCTEAYRDKCPVGSYLSMGSGMVIDLIKNQTIILTAGHVCKSEVDETKILSHTQSISVIDHKGFEHDAYVIKSTDDNGKGSIDACALWAPTIKEKGVKFSMFEPKVGQELYYIGSPSGIYHPPVAPILTGLYSGQIDVSNSLVSIPATGGSSGSAVMDLNNRIVGILWAAHEFHHVSIVTNWHATSLFLYDIARMYNGKEKINLPLIRN